MFTRTKLEALRDAEAAAMAKLMLVDTQCKIKRADISQAVETVADHFDCNYKFIVDEINSTATNPRAAITSIRLSKLPRIMLIITDQYTQVDSWVKTYQNKGIETHVLEVEKLGVGSKLMSMIKVSGTWEFDNDFNISEDYPRKTWFMKTYKSIGEIQLYTGEEYLDEYGTEYLLTKIVKYRTAPNRTILEDFAEEFSAPLGWNFSGPIRDTSIAVNQSSQFRDYDTIPYAGWKGNYGFADTIRMFNSTMITDTAVSGKTTVTPSRKTKLLVGKPCLVSELIEFRDYLLALIDADILKESLEEGWTLCECGHPVRTVGQLESDGFCQYCDRPIPNFTAITFVDIDTINLAGIDKNFLRIESDEE